MNMISVKNVVKRFSEGIALNNVSVEFEKGMIHGLIGRNGSGKTVLLKCICGFMYPDEGTISVDGKIIGKDVDMPRNVGVIIETPGFLPNYSGIKNLLFLAKIQNRISKAEVANAMHEVGLDPKSKKHVGHYSMGMRQRLGIAQALMESPSLLILDEPLNGLDNRGVQEIRNVLLELKAEGKTILLASHNSEDISILCDTVHQMDGGNIKKIR
jgi:ABC-2 type transport system ATP-binding protein